jgi:acetate kinase
MGDAVLALNAGSSSLKFALFEAGSELGAVLLRGSVAGLPDDRTLAELLASLDREAVGTRVVAVGHRVVHGGERFTVPALIDDAALAELHALEPLAPLHQPHNLAAVEAYRRAHPGVPQVACFDTAFHRTQPAVATALGLPRALGARGIRRYGFHGLSYEYIAGKLPEVLGPAADGRIVVAHLGNGASMCALRERRSQATTMGFSALDGLLMGTRCGALDPGVLLYLLEQGMPFEELRALLWERSGLLGVSGISADMRVLLASGDVAAAEAIELFVYRAVREAGSLIAALGGLDALVFTGGIGEHAALVRTRICAGLGWLGMCLNDVANGGDAQRISAAESALPVLVLPTDEELIVARHTWALVTTC